MWLRRWVIQDCQELSQAHVRPCGVVDVRRPAEAVGVGVLRSWPVLDRELVVGQSLQPSLHHADWLLQAVYPFERLVVRAEDERAVLQVVGPVPHEDDRRGQFPLGARVVGLALRQLLGTVCDDSLPPVLFLRQYRPHGVVFLGPVRVQDERFLAVEARVGEDWGLPQCCLKVAEAFLRLGRKRQWGQIRITVLRQQISQGLGPGGIGGDVAAVVPHLAQEYPDFLPILRGRPPLDNLDVVWHGGDTCPSDDMPQVLDLVLEKLAFGWLQLQSRPGGGLEDPVQGGKVRLQVGGVDETIVQEGQCHGEWDAL